VKKLFCWQEMKKSSLTIPKVGTEEAVENFTYRYLILNLMIKRIIGREGRKHSCEAALSWK
jgi:hypothetical protein